MKERSKAACFLLTSIVMFLLIGKNHCNGMASVIKMKKKTLRIVKSSVAEPKDTI